MRTHRNAVALSLAAALLFFFPSLRPAAGQFLGPEFQVNSYTSSDQRYPAVAADGSGNFIVVWQSPQDGWGNGVFGQRFDWAGVAAGGEFRVNSFTTSQQRHPAVAADGAGNFVVVWESYFQDATDYGVFGQRFDDAGNPVGSEFRVNSYTTSHQNSPAVAMDGSGNFVVAWQSYLQDGAGYGAFAQRFDSAGSPVGSEFRVNSYTTGSQNGPAVAADDAGSFVVVWVSAGQDGSYAGVFGQRFDAAGTPAGSEFRVNSYVAGDQMAPAVAADGAGNFVVVWESYQDTSGFGVFAQRFNAVGSPQGTEFRVNTYVTLRQHSAAVAATTPATSSWSGAATRTAPSMGCSGSGSRRQGGRVGNEFRVNSYTTGHQTAPAVAAGGWAISLRPGRADGQDGSGWGIAGKQLNATIFYGNFEAGDVCAWSAAVGGGSCPRTALRSSLEIEGLPLAAAIRSPSASGPLPPVGSSPRLHGLQHPGPARGGQGRLLRCLELVR